ncbi:MAG: hormogonium polysaccharide biosynthesis protein HpsA [Limnoraphis robusta]
MSTRKMIQNFQLLLMAMQKFYRQTVRRFRRSLLKTWMKMNQGDRYGRAGFVLPTVTMVLLVVVLLTIAITLRSFQRSQMAQYRRVDEAVLAAASPALDRASAKLKDVLFNGGNGLLPPRETPSESLIYQALAPIGPQNNNDPEFYTLPDEERLVIEYDTEDNGIDPDVDVDLVTKPLENRDQLKTAWRFPVDTDNDGFFDSFNYYGIYLRTPGVDNQGNQRARSPIDARTSPINLDQTDCASITTVAGLVGESGWEKIEGDLKKAFFTYTTTVPITQEDIDNGNLVIKNNIGPEDYEPYQGTAGFSALEYQQDFTRKPLSNNAVVYEDDLDISSSPTFNLNGRIVTNSNLLVSPRGNNPIRLYQVSDPDSCFYKAENSKITVAGNVVVGIVDLPDARNVDVDLFRPGATPAASTLTNNTDSTGNSASQVLYNNQAYEQRIEALDAASGTNDAEHFQERTRKVPFAEVGVAGATTATLATYGTNNEEGPADPAMLPVQNDGVTANGTGITLNSQLPATEPDLDNDPRFENGEQRIGDRIAVGNNLPARYFYDGSWKGADAPMNIQGAVWTDTGNPRYRTTQVQPLPQVDVIDRDGELEQRAALQPDDPKKGASGGLRVITGAGIYDRSKSFLPPPVPARMTVGGNTYNVVWPDTMPMFPPLMGNGATPPSYQRVPSSKVYDNSSLYNADGSPSSSFGNNMSANWTDTTVASGNDQYARGDLRMRATAVYHYTENTTPDTTDPTLTQQEPIACVSSFYDPTNALTAKNAATSGSLNLTGTWNDNPLGHSNNGIVYPWAPASGIGDSDADLVRQANYIFPDGRLANPVLREALNNTGTRTLSQQAAVHSAKCALAITRAEEGTLSSMTPNNSIIPHGAISEISFLDAREVKALDANVANTVVDETFSLLVNPDGTAAAPNLTTNYSHPLEDRYPLEVRATQIDLDLLRNTPITQTVTSGPNVGGEYLLPLSGILYASREDALPDQSNPSSLKQSGADFMIDPSRRPNGILLINGEGLARNDGDGDGHNDDARSTDDVLQEKGLIFGTNAPAYIWGNFNLHRGRSVPLPGQDPQIVRVEEFNELVDANNWNGTFYSRTTLNDQFACRPNDNRLPNCTRGDAWRSATIIADSISLLTRDDNDLSRGFRFGFRNEGDFDLRNNAGNYVILGYDFSTATPPNGIQAADLVNENDYGIDLNGNGTVGDTNVRETQVTAKAARELNGFNAYNDFAVNGLSSGALFDTDEDGTFAESYFDVRYSTQNSSNNTTFRANSSYFNNFVTPVQRRVQFSEYVMEMCLKLPVSACRPQDWKIIVDGSGGTAGIFDSSDTFDDATTVLGDPLNTATLRANLLSGTTAKPPAIELQRFPRRVAFERNGVNLSRSSPVPLGIAGGQIVNATTTAPATPANALWFQTNNTGKSWDSTSPSLWYYDPASPNTSRTYGTTVQQPLLVPVLQIHATDIQNPQNNYPLGQNVQLNTWWLPRSANATTYNFVAATGDTPARPDEFNGGLQNLVRFLENFGVDPNKNTTNILGSFIQIGRSNYATAPYQSLRNVNNLNPATIYGNNNWRTYRTGNSIGRTPFFVAPNRAWGFDVGLLSQPPDLFTDLFTVRPSSIEPNEYFREVNRDDPWVESLLCSKRYTSGQGAGANAVNNSYLPRRGC